MSLCVCHLRQKRREREIQQQMESRDEETLELKETYSSLQQEVDIKTKKLKKVERKQSRVGVRSKASSCVAGGSRDESRPWLCLSVAALFQAASGEGRDPRPPGGAHQGAPGAGTDPE